MSKEEFERLMIETYQENLEINKVPVNTENAPSVKGDGPYYHAGAVNYAHTWAFDHNPAYPNFGGSDCTNFVSQAIYEGGHIPMTYAKSGIGTSGWFYTDINNRAAAWVWAPSLYSFIVNNENPNFFDNGPKGYEVYGLSNVSQGDIILYDFSNQPYQQDHAVMLVTWSATQPLVAGHSPNVDYFPYNSFNYISRTYLLHITGY